MDLAIRIILCVIFPPLAVFDKGLGAILLVLLLTCLGLAPRNHCGIDPLSG